MWKYPKARVEAIWGDTKPAKRGEAVERFNTDQYVNGNTISHGGVDILIFTANVGAYGFNLAARCFRSVQFEPWTSASKEAQARARIWRGGQQNPLCEHYVLMDKRFGVEAAVMALRDGRQAVAEEMYSIAD